MTHSYAAQPLHWALRRASALKKLTLQSTESFSALQQMPLSLAKIKQVIRATLNVIGVTHSVEMALSLVTKKEMQSLNYEFRQKDSPTNILSFSEIDTDMAGMWPKRLRFLGELVICPEVIIKEAKIYGLPLSHRWLHLLVHGTLHLLGYDHEKEHQRKVMEQLEIDILTLFHLSNPYLIEKSIEA